MKNLFLFTIAVFTLISCENPVSKKIDEVTESVSEATEVVKSANKIKESMSDMESDMEKLQNTTPLTNAELKEWLPQEFDGMKRTSFKAGKMSSMGVSSIEATYKMEGEDKSFKIEVVDGAGPTASAMMMGMRMILTQDMEEEDENKLKRTAVRDGNKVLEEYYKSRNKSTIMYMQSERFFITGTGENMNLDETWDAIKDFKVNNLD